MNKQVGKENYEFNNYLSLQRWSSYWYQIKETYKIKPESVLEIGGGDGVYGDYIRNKLKISYKSCDIADDLNADIIGDVRNLPIQDNSFDMVCAFQVLEHIPFEDFSKCISEMARVSKGHVLISLPHYGPNIKLLFKIPMIREIRLLFKMTQAKEHRWDGQHYFEIGKKGTLLADIKKHIENHLIIEKDFIPFENNYHHFFICRKK